MKRKILIAIGIIVILLILTFIYAFIISFKVVKQTTDNINLVLKEKFQNIVRIPEPIPPSLKSFESTNYTWEMETKEKEITTVVFSHETNFDKRQDKIIATLEMTQGGDPSLFVKVLPAVIADNQALQSVNDLEHANLGPNPRIGYNKIELFTKDENSPQVIKIVWEFNKDVFTNDIGELYNNLNKYPKSLLRFLYGVQRTTLLLLAP